MRLRLRSSALLVPLVWLGAAHAAAGPEAARRPIAVEPGLIIVSAVHDLVQNKDYEAVVTVDAIDAQGLHKSEHWTIPNPQAPGGVEHESYQSLERPQDSAQAHRLILWHLRGDPETFPGATWSTASMAVFEELRSRGESTVAVGAVSKNDGALPGLLSARKYFRGTLHRLGSETVRVLLDGVPTALPTLHAGGTLTLPSDSAPVEFWWLDDPATRFALKFTIQGSTMQVVRIDRPQGSNPDIGVASPLQALSGKSCRSEVPGIYFLTDSAELLAVSEPAISRIAALLGTHPDWVLTIEGHTDNTGGDEHNLDLSKRRAASLKSELVRRYHIAEQRLTTVGYGRARPIDTNDTLEGRAHNRRVEIARRC